MGRSTESGRRYLSHAVEGCYRLPRCWARLEAGELPAWRLAFIADRTMCLSPEAAAFVDAKVAPFAHNIGPAQLGRLVEEAKARFDPEATEAERRAAAEARPLRHRDRATRASPGPCGSTASWTWPTPWTWRPRSPPTPTSNCLLGSTESLDVRRAIAAGNLARTQQTLDLATTRQPTAAAPTPQREVVLHVHLEHAAVARRRRTGPAPRGPGPVTAEQVREWCAQPDTQVTVQPVLDLAEHLHVGSYEASARLKLQTQLRDHTCAFPFCSRPAEQCDCEHRVPHDPDRDDAGPTCTCNLAPCCRRHHRAKTTGGWTYVTIEPGTYLWRSPLGYQFLRDHTGTLDVTPTPNAAASPAPSPPTSARPTRPARPTPNPDHPAPHPAQDQPSGGIGMRCRRMVGRSRQRHVNAEPTAARADVQRHGPDWLASPPTVTQETRSRRRITFLVPPLSVTQSTPGGAKNSRAIPSGSRNETPEP